MNITIRPATAADAPQVADIHLACRRAFMPYAPSAHTEEDVHQWTRDTLIAGGGVTVACDEEEEESGSIVAYVAVANEDGIDWINHLYVTPSRTGQGIGTLLLDLALSRLKRPIRLYTFQANARARALYERHGFKPLEFTDGSGNEERCPDVLYELS